MPELVDDKIIIRTSDRNFFKRCRRLWNWNSKIRENWEPLFVPQPLDFGTAIHKGLEARYVPEFYVVSSPEALTASSVAAFSQESKRQKDEYLKVADKETLDDDQKRDFEEELKLGTKMLTYYGSVAPELDKWFKPVKVEIEFEVPLPFPFHAFKEPPGNFTYNKDTGQLGLDGIPIVYQGRVDLLVEDEDDWYWIVDHKTEKQHGQNDWLDLDEQGGSYAWALSLMLGLKIRGVIYNQLVKGAPADLEPLKRGGFSKNKQQRTTYKHYLAELQRHGAIPTDYRDFLEFLRTKEDPFIHREVIHRSRNEQVLLGQQIGLEAIDMLSDPLIYPNPGKFTCMGCSFKAPCLAAANGSDHEFILRDQFRKRTSAS